MTQGLLVLWIVSSLAIVFETRTYRLIIYFSIFSLITSVAYFLLGSPDVAMAEAAIAAFASIFFIICIEKYYSRKENVEKDSAKGESLARKAVKAVPALVLCVGLFFLVIYFIPGIEPSHYLKHLYLQRFMTDVGGENAVTAIYLGYRVYDTLFEALILVIAVVAVTHMSYSEKTQVADGSHSEIETSRVAALSLRIICPIIVAFGAYLIINGHISAGGGFQGGLALATFFICRYMVYDIYDISVKNVLQWEEFIFAIIIVVTAIAVFLGAATYMPAAIVPIYQSVYLIIMNLLIGLKVACAFFVLFYRYITIERE
ncbi:MAG: DUF4040 domain-containing protein [Defluviitaleaceae bacterium]|nr:DUF4040 domain-containing protein [Defluviitaleaceae bacterium]MCL2239234.1 DUF4040 domain-containing protein [Defluviitaleaceae bacterium]MCL2239812.1 DUF4040 domain-containing protein [Defluviitaleaceae bacterium]